MINWGVVNHIICLVLEAFKWSAFLYRDRYWRSCVWSSGWHDRWRLSVKHQQYLHSQQCYISPQSCNPRKAMPAFLDTTVVALVTEVGDQVGHILVYVWYQCNLFFFTLKMSSVLGIFRACLHRVSESTLGQLCDCARHIVLIENNGIAPELSYHPFLSDSFVFNENTFRVVAVLNWRLV